MPYGDEAKHVKVLGTTGTGKTTAIRGLIADALARGDRAVIADPDGSFVRDFFDAGRGDRVLGPFAAGASTWDLRGELACRYDADALARALVPEAGGEDRAWRTYARTFVASLLRQLSAARAIEIAELHRLVTRAPVDELRLLLEATSAEAFLADENARFFASVRAIASSELAHLEYLEPVAAAPAVSVRGWIRDARAEKGPRALFIPYQSQQLASIRGLVACWLRMAIFETMELGEDDQRIWFIIDELDAVGAIDGLKDALTRLRKYGGRCVLGLQSISQLSGAYGSSAAQTIIENCGSSLILRCGSSEHGGTARFASTLIGEHEVLREQVSVTEPAAFSGADRTRSRALHRHVEKAVLPAEIEQLADLEGYLRFASSTHWMRIRVPQ